MNALIENGYIYEMSCGANFSYILNDSCLFQAMEYKVMQSQVNSGFVKCMKMLYNGKVQLYYITNTYKPFSTMISSLDPEGFLTIIANLLSVVIAVKNNGFLSCQNLDIDLEHIFVDPSTYKVSLLYLPLNKKIYREYSVFENDLRTSLVRLITGMGALASPKTIQFCGDLSNGMIKLEDLPLRIKGSKSTRSRTKVVIQPKEEHKEPKLRLKAINGSTKLEILVSKAEFVLGKNAAMVDGVVSFNNMISRVHCKINKSRDGCTVTDLESKNGTYLNGSKLQPNRPQPVKDGDVLRMADSDFIISIS